MAIKNRGREPGRDGKILSDHKRQNGNVAVGGVCQENRASRPPVVGHGLTFEYDCSN